MKYFNGTDPEIVKLVSDAKFLSGNSQISAQNQSLQNLDNYDIFIPGLLGFVHQQCSPWSSQEIEEVYQKAYQNSLLSYKIGSSIPVLYQNLPSNSNGLDCNVCLKLFTFDDLIMKIPVTYHDYEVTQKKIRLRNGTAVCQCSSLLNGHFSNCDFA